MNEDENLPEQASETGAEIKADARKRGLRSVFQALAITVLVGAAAGVDAMVEAGDVVTLTTVGTAAGVGALMALTAWVQRRLGK